MATFPVNQLVDLGLTEKRETLPSFHFEPTKAESAGGGMGLPWTKNHEYAIGFFARDHGSKAPARMIASAKSWLCHSGVDRTAEILPWRGAEDVERLSPVDVSSRILRHLRDAWDHDHSDAPLAEQDIVLTLPASFDEIARELTIEAARRAGLERVVLIEEPQAAFYSWIDRQEEEWQKTVTPGQKILICDIGGGTTDFTLIRVREGEEGKIQFHRVAVGEHLLLGGDNLDLALAHHIQSAQEQPFDPRQWEVLLRACRAIKETFLAPHAPDSYTLNLPGGGSKLIGGSLQIEVKRDELVQVLLDGFLPDVSLDDKPSRQVSGFQEFGLPFAADSAITKYLASFLSTHRTTGMDDDAESLGHDPARPDLILFNGGFFESDLLQQRLLDVICSWFRDKQDPEWTPQVLQNERLDLAVARGAAYYGLVRRGEGVRISANLARSYYIGIEDPQGRVVCLLPGSAEPGQDLSLEQEFVLRVSQPVEFPLYSSSVRLTDLPGELVSVDQEQMSALPPVRTALRKRRRADADEARVSVHARMTEIGTLELWCAEVGGERSWRLEFDIRSTTQTDVQAHTGLGETSGFIDEETWSSVEAVLDTTFSAKDAKPEQLMKRLAEVSQMKKHEWPPSMLRRIWGALLEREGGRRFSQAHESRWLNLLGYTLRPGYGIAVDDWRVSETWKQVQGKLAHHSPMSRTESLILWRRISGGLSAGQHRAIAEPLLAPVRTLHKRLTKNKGGASVGMNPHESTEIWRLLGSLERLHVSLKVELGNMLHDLIPKRKIEPVRPALVWALGRVGTRQPVYGPLNGVVQAKHAEKWLDLLMTQPNPDGTTFLAAMQLARKTGDRYRDVSEQRREEVIEWLRENDGPQHLHQLVAEGGQLDEEEQGRVFGESLPLGLRLGS